MGQTTHVGCRAGWSAAVAASVVLVVGSLTAGCSSPVSARATQLHEPVGVTVVRPNGTTVRGVDGLTLHGGDVVRTAGGTGRAELVTESRTVYVGSAAAVEVVNGAEQSLRAGAVVVDAQHGPGLQLTVGGLAVHTPAGVATRAERSVTVRIGALAGATEVTSSTGRRLTIPALHQTVVGGDALPDLTTPLRLTDDDGEAHAVPQLVRDDRTLVSLALGIDETGRSTTRVVTAAMQRPLNAPPGLDRSERVLPAVIAAAGPRSGVVQRYDAAVGYRAAGGSWGVVAHLVGVGAGAVVTTLADFERHQPPGRIGSVGAVLASATGGPAGATGAGTGTGPAGGSGGGNGGGSGGSGSGSGGGGGGGATPTPSPSPSGGSGGVVGSAIDTVLSLVPTPTPTPTPSGGSASTPVITLPSLRPLP
ncbi:MAG TPA: hypothetical protein VFT62_07845 [Mycobacteriales bacterium]|nr:hypothetical protein [Mycobacteriales bacterium]